MAEADLFGLRGAHVIVTGASGGIGLSITDFFLNKLGARVSAHANSNLDVLVRMGTTAHSLNTNTADATSEQEVMGFYEIARNLYGRPQVLIGTERLA